MTVVTIIIIITTMLHDNYDNGIYDQDVGDEDIDHDRGDVGNDDNGSDMIITIKK